MYSWQYNEKMIRDWIYNHAKDCGRFSCQLMIDSPLIYAEFLRGFYDEYNNRFRQGQRVGGDDTSPPNEDGVSRG